MQNLAQTSGIRGLLEAVGNLINPIISILVGVALIVFLWGLAKFLLRLGGDEKAVADGKKLMIWGVLALFVAVSVAGIIRFAQIQLGLPPIPPNTGSDIPNMNPFFNPAEQNA